MFQWSFAIDIASSKMKIQTYLLSFFLLQPRNDYSIQTRCSNSDFWTKHILWIPKIHERVKNLKTEWDTWKTISLVSPFWPKSSLDSKNHEIEYCFTKAVQKNGQKYANLLRCKMILFLKFYYLPKRFTFHSTSSLLSRSYCILVPRLLKKTPQISVLHTQISMTNIISHF